MNTNRIADNPGVLKHNEEIGFLNRLIIDLKKIQLGNQPSNPITMERLNVADQMIQKLFSCRVPTSFK